MIDTLNEVLKIKLLLNINSETDPDAITNENHRFIGFGDMDNNVFKINLYPEESSEIIDKIYDLENNNITLVIAMNSNNLRDLEEYLSGHRVKDIEPYKLYKILINTIEYFKMDEKTLEYYNNIKRILIATKRNKIIDELL